MRRRGFLARLQRRFTRDIGIDLGTANTLVHVAGKGVVIREPSVVAIDKDTGEVLAVGEEAKQMLGRTPANIVATRPLRDGVIADFRQTEAMLRYFIGRVARRSLLRMTVVVGIPSGITEVERDAVLDAVREAGAHQAFVIDEPYAAALGAGLPVDEASGSMIVDIGGGTTEVAVIALGGIVHSNSVRVAGDELDEAIAAYVRRAYNLTVGERTAEAIKIEIGSAYPLAHEREMTIKGRDLVSGLPRSADIKSDEVRLAIQEPLRAIVAAVTDALEETPPDLAADVMDRGIVLAGGGALLRGLDRLIQEETGIPVTVAADPLGCVVVGTGMVVEALHNKPKVRRMLERTSRA